MSDKIYSVYKVTRLGVKRSTEEILIYKDKDIAEEVTKFLNSKSKDLVKLSKTITFTCSESKF